MKTLQIFLKRSRATILFSVTILLSAFLVSATIAPSALAEDRLIVDPGNCFGCGLCELIAPECFVIVDEVACVIYGWEAYPDLYMEALESCPGGAIRLANY